MKRTRKIKAFTVLELIVVMIMSSIVILALFSVMGNTQQLFQMSITQSYREVEQLEFFQFLQNDIRKAQSVSMLGGEITIEMPGKSYVYEFSDALVVRKRDSIVDTFFVTVQDLEGFRHPELRKCISKVSFVLPELFDEESLVISKQYTRGQIFNVNSMPAKSR